MTAQGSEWAKELFDLEKRRTEEAAPIYDEMVREWSAQHRRDDTAIPPLLVWCAVTCFILAGLLVLIAVLT